MIVTIGHIMHKAQVACKMLEYLMNYLFLNQSVPFTLKIFNDYSNSNIKYPIVIETFVFKLRNGQCILKKDN